ncbi:MAG: MlaD family protein [Gemmatimonadota bacterium]|nr:MlaD family protein [Gemmatimonadota bacterium]MDE2985884.1 MlaD family protein [Gemmatimonadota bacterium]
MERRREILVGAVVVLGIAVGVIGTIWLKGGWGSNQVALRTASTGVGQLVAGASVKFRGVAVGRVESVAVVPSGEAVMVEMTVRPDLAIPADAAVVIAPESFFGDWQAEITTRDEYGSLTFYEHAEEGVLAGAVLPDFSRLTATADEIARRLTVMSDRFELAFTEETALNLRHLIDNLGLISDDLTTMISQQATRFDELAVGVSESAREFTAAARVARSTLERMDGILTDADVGTLLGNAGESMENLKTLTGDMRAAMTELRTAAQQGSATMTRLETLLASAESGEGLLGRLLADPELAEGATAAVANLNRLLADIKENPTRYLSFSIF